MHFLCVFFRFFAKIAVFGIKISKKRTKFLLIFYNFTFECGGSRGQNTHIYQFAYMSTGSREDDSLVLRGASEHIFMASFRVSFDEHLDHLAYLALVAFEREGVLQGDDLVEPAHFLFLADVVGQVFLCVGARSFGVFEHECGIEAYLNTSVPMAASGTMRRMAAMRSRYHSRVYLRFMSLRILLLPLCTGR